MNEFEKKAVKMLSEKEREEIVGGATESDELSKEQCERLQNVMKHKYHKEPYSPTLITYGGPTPGSRPMVAPFPYNKA